MEELTVKALIDNVETVIEYVNDKLDTLNCPGNIRAQMNIAIDEIISNIANYAYGPDRGPVTVRMEVKTSPTTIVLIFIDHGAPFNPLARTDPDITLPARARKIGGLGIYMVKKSMDNMTYEYRDGMNILTLYKRLPF